jgi:putative PIN family toxin of toxin-antitoxin system
VLRITPDTNILVSGLVFRRGKPHQLLRMALEGTVSMTVSQAIIGETLDVLGRKFGATADDLDEARAIIQEAARTVTPTVQLDVIKEDPPDNRILECAVTAGSNYIVTADKDLLRLGHYDAIQIVTVSELVDTLERLEGNG